MAELQTWLKYTDKRFITLFYKPLRIFFKQFFKFFFIALIPELIIYGISRLIIIEVSTYYNSLIGRTILGVSIDFSTEFGRDSFFILLILALIIFVLRSSIITNIAWKTIEEGKANTFLAIVNSIKKIKEIIVFTVFIIVLLIFPILMVTLALMIQPRLYYLSWVLILMAIILPLMFGNKMSLFIAGMAKDNYHIGAAIQISWQLSRRRNWFKVTFMFLLYICLGLLIPWGVSLYITQIYPMLYVGACMAIFRSLCYPLFDIALTLSYMNADYNALDDSYFKDEIIEQRKQSKELIEKGLTNKQ